MADIQTKLMRAVDKMPGFPQSVQQILEMTADINCSQRELVEVIKKDPVFTLKILRMVNSAYFSLAQEVTSVNQASVYLGLNTLKNVALGLAVIGTLPMTNPAGFDMRRFWLHSLSVAAAARLLGARLEQKGGVETDYFAAGLLHDMGKIVFALYAPEDYRGVLERSRSRNLSLHDVEYEIFGLSHADIGSRLASTWNLPAELTRCIAGHHSAMEGSRLTSCVSLANQVVKHLGYGYAGNSVVEELQPHLAKLFPGDVPTIAESLTELESEVEKARMFVQLGGVA
ncbi:MAG: HDOD domain-containing protein [Desulfovibrio sp.]